jgi:tellurite resistance protein TerC
MLFAGLLVHLRGREEATEFVTGYLIELSLSLDNILVIALIFAAFPVPPEFQRRVLVWGILGALVMRGAMIGVGAALVQNFSWVLYVFGAFLVFTGVKMFFSKKEPSSRKKIPSSASRENCFRFRRAGRPEIFTRLNGALALTPLALVLLLVETTDLIFAVDSVPAVFSVTQKAFIVFTSNVFAILGLRSLYFLLAGAIGLFPLSQNRPVGRAGFHRRENAARPARPRAAMVSGQNSRPPLSLLVVAAILAIAIALSITAARAEKKENHSEMEQIKFVVPIACF